MPLSKLTTDLNIHQSLPNQPNANDGLTPEELKAKFDEAANLIKDYVNNTLTVEQDIKNTQLQDNINTVSSTLQNNIDTVNTVLQADINIKDVQNVKITGNQSIAGVKTFSDVPLSANQPTNANQVANKAYVDTRELHLQGQVTANANNISNLQLADTQNVKLTGNQTVTGVKTFSDNPVVPTPTQNAHASTKQYVDESIGAVVLGQIPDNSLTDAKLSNEEGQIKETVTSLGGEVTQISENLIEHQAESMPHKFTKNDVTYKYGFKTNDDLDGLIFVYEEA